jgi:threonine/homoserine/homoserine lactone efflux protein
MSIVLNGIQFGIVLAFLVGPVFFAIIQTSVERGFSKGVLVSAGVSFSDISYVIICYLGLIQLIENESFRHQMGYFGGGVLIAFGLYHLIIKSRKSIAPPTVAPQRSALQYFMKGFVINGFSPMVPLYWIGTLSYASVNLGYVETSDFIIFYSALLTTVLVTDILKAYLADKLRRLITPRLMMWLNILVGIALMAFGVRLVLQS